MIHWPSHVPGGRPLLGANGTEAMSVLLERDGANLVDYLKVGPFMGAEAVAALAARSPLLLHLDDTLSGNTPPSAALCDRLRDWVRLTGSPWTSEHLGFSVAETTMDEDLMMQPASEGLSRAQALANISRNARALAEGLSVPLLLENVPFYPNVVHLHITDPDFIREVLDLSGCDMLLDLAHARVSADALGIPVQSYVAALPLERVREIHLSGPRPLSSLPPQRQARVYAGAQALGSGTRYHDASLMDAHEPLQPDDYALLAWTLERCHPRALSLEYYRDAGQLTEQLVQLGRMIGRPGAA